MDFRNESDKHKIEDAVNAAPMHGTATPVGAVTPKKIGQIYVDTATPAAYVATGLTNADWFAI